MIVSFILGIVLIALGIWWYAAVGFSIQAILAALVIAGGGALVTVGIGIALDKKSPTSRKL
ncbi:hypothetical protein [Corynebacterium renale]|nr:hypothetical protein [Corynebacterium renale]